MTLCRNIFTGKAVEKRRRKAVSLRQETAMIVRLQRPFTHDCAKDFCSLFILLLEKPPALGTVRYWWL